MRGTESGSFYGLTASQYSLAYGLVKGAHPPDGGQLSVAPRKVVRCVVVQVEPACILDELVLSLSAFTHRSLSTGESERSRCRLRRGAHP